MEGVTEVVAFGLQAFINRYLVDYFNDHFFYRPLDDVLIEYERVVKHCLGVEDPDSSHIKALHELGYLPLLIHAVPEGTLVPLRVPMITIENTLPEFFWLTNYIETLFSTEMWMPSTSATTAFEYRKLLQRYAKETGNEDFVPFQGHDFSMRGMSSVEAAASSGAGHLLSFVGTDSIPAIHFLEAYYDANIELEMVGVSVPATEHSVMCAYGQDEVASYRHLLTEVYPTGIVSIVSDTWDLWAVLNNVLGKELRDVVLARDGKLVVRPDSGDPVKIICGDPESDDPNERKGVVEILWDLFGGAVNDKGFKELDPHVGVIYGDAITLERCRAICEGLKQKGFASTNMVFGIGSFTYQHVTRDTFGFALKSTWVQINGEEHPIFKNPATDKSGVKKSLVGRVAVVTGDDGKLEVEDNLNYVEWKNMECADHLNVVFDGHPVWWNEGLSEIRDRLLSNLED
jgi:nicotinamide phosphoribosyltransferase